MSQTPITPQKLALNAFLTTPIKATEPMSDEAMDRLEPVRPTPYPLDHLANRDREALRGIVRILYDAREEDKPAIVAEVVEFARETLSTFQPDLIDGAGPEVKPTRIAKAIAAGTKALEGESTASDGWISNGDDDDDLGLADMGLTDPASTSSTGAAPPSPRKTTSLVRLSHGLSGEITADRLEGIMAEFRERLVDLGEFAITKGKKAGVSSWSADRATVLANHIFADMIGGLKGRLVAIVRSYNHVDRATGISSRTAVLANEAATRSGYPRAVREFCQTVAKGIEFDQSHSAWKTMLKQANEYRKFHALETLKDRARAHDAEIITFLQGQGLQARQGVTWTSLLVTFLVDLFQIGTRSQLNNLCTSGKAISSLVEVFGPGSLVFLHPTSTHK